MAEVGVHSMGTLFIIVSGGYHISLTIIGRVKHVGADQCLQHFVNVVCFLGAIGRHVLLAADKHRVHEVTLTTLVSCRSGSG